MVLLMSFLHIGLGQESEEIDFESDLLSWPRMKRYAGYRAEDGKYRGGLYKWARDEELELYRCVLNNTEHCLTWITRESSSEETEEGRCHCLEDDTPYCASWVCSEVEIARSADCSGDGPCRDITQAEHTECSCEETDADDRYCRVWRCFEDGADGFIEEEEYTCLEEDVSREYCFRWRGDISSSYELESSVCQCTYRAETYCKSWECQERGLIRCAAHEGGWCDLNVSIGVGGGFGVVCIIIGKIWALVSEEKYRYARLSVWFLFGCLPWTAGVVIWGGVRGLPIVAGMWMFALVFSCIHIYLCREREPPSDIQMVEQPPAEYRFRSPVTLQNFKADKIPHYLK